MSQNAADSNYQSLMKKALLELKQMRAKLSALEDAKTEPIAIVGMGCRFPGGANNPDAFWQLLHEGVDAITEVPRERWNIDAYYDPDPDTPGKMYTRYGGFVGGLDKFDSQFFNITPREAISLDPQQRLLLEVSWEALENAGVASDRLAGSSTGVFIGICSNDYSQRLLARNPTAIDAYVGTGNCHSVASGRLSYLLGLTGPSLAVDTACSSSLVAVHLAIASLRSGESNLALAGGVNLLLAPEVSINFSKARMLSGDGRCKTFDATADGYTRAEGCGVVVLKRLSDALNDGDNILALIRGSAVNQDGRSSGLTVPNGPSQQAAIRQALENGGVEPAEVSYIEAHGTGTALGDPIEVGALAGVFAKNRSSEHPLAIGSVKTNVGHLEGAAGIAGLIKVVLSLQHQEIPPHLHFQQPSPYINWGELPVVVPTEPLPWSADTRRRIAGVSSFGFSGTNAHVVIEEAPLAEPTDAELERPKHLLALSAKTETALLELAQRYQSHLAAHPNLSLADICFTSNYGRSHFPHRLSLVADSTAELSEKLAASTASRKTPGVIRSKVQGTTQPKLAWLFTGQGSQYIGMGRQLYQTQPVFRQTLQRCAEILQPYLDKPLLEIIFNEDRRQRAEGRSDRETGRQGDGETALVEKSPSPQSPLNQTQYTQPALFAIEYALAQLWLSWGIRPNAVMGHSVGEYVAATIAGVFSLEDALKLIARRGKLMQALPSDGSMVALLATQKRVLAAIEPHSDVAIAAINGANNVVISGNAEGVAAVTATLAAEGVKSIRLNVSHAFHSPLMEPMLAEFQRVASQLTYSPPRIPLISNLTGREAAAEIATPRYWCRHIVEPVNFAASIKELQRQQYHHFIEMGAKPILSGMGRQCLAAGESNGSSSYLWLPSLRQGVDDWQQLLESLAKLYVCGVKVDWRGFDRDYPRRKLPLPTYPFQRQRYWFAPGDGFEPNVSLEVKSSSDTAVPEINWHHKRDELLNANPKERRRLLESYFSQLLERVMGVSAAKLDWQQRLSDLGLDSLMATELRKQLEENFGIEVPVEFLAELSIERFFTQVLWLIEQQASAKPLPEVNSQDIATNGDSAISATDNSWIICPRPNERANLRLFCFPYAGAGISCYRTWTECLPPEIEICSIQLPGRENRSREAPFKRLKPLITTLAPLIQPYLDKPFAFFGHSMGALLSFELARELRRRNWQCPANLLVSGSRAPQLPDPEPPIHRLPEAKFKEKLKRLKGIPEEVLENSELMQLFLPTLRADFELLETYFYLNEKPLDCPITAFGGLADNKVSQEELAAWREQTNSEFSLQVFAGDHFFLHTASRKLLPAMAQQMKQVLILK